MQNNQENLNTEPNYIAGNSPDGPVGNTAAQHNGGPGIGQPGTGATAPAAAPSAAPASSESLADSEVSVGQGAVEGNDQRQENREANPADLQPTDTYGGNFGNSTQGSYRDEDRRENQDADPNRGEFGTQGQRGTTHGGFGNQNRLADYEPANTPEDQYYGGPGAPGPQTNSYRTYDGRDERPGGRAEYGFEPGAAATPNPGPKSAASNDNGSPKGADSGFAKDYGSTSLRAMQGVGPKASSPANPDRRNQTADYDYMPAPASPANTTAGAANPEATGQRPVESQGYGDRGRDQPDQAPKYGTGDTRNGYVKPEANKGDAAQGTGSRGGSYNDAYDDSQPNSRAGSPAKGEERSEDRSQNYGSAARDENRTGDDDNADHGAPRRNAGRDGVADE